MDDTAQLERMGGAMTRGYNDIAYFAEVFLGMPLHEGQKKFLRNATAKTNVLVPANRWGKTTVIAIKHIHHCFYKVGIGRGNQDAWAKASYTTVNLSPHSDTTRPVFEAIIQILRSSYTIHEGGGKITTNKSIIGWMLNEKRIRNSVPLYIPFTNNSDILFRSTGEDQGKSIEGRSYGYISYDEGGQSGHLEYERTRRVLPRLGEYDGQFDIVSTPELTSPSILEHYELFQKGGGEGHGVQEGFYSQEGSIEENHFFLRANPSYIKDMKNQMKGNPIIEQILYGKFVFSGANIFPTPDIIDAKDETLDQGEVFKNNHTYVIGTDTAMGEDEMVFTVIDTTTKPFRLVRQMAHKGNTKSPQIHMADFEGIFRHYNKQINAAKHVLETYNGESARFFLDLPYDIQVATVCFGAWQPQGRKTIGRNAKNVKKAEIILALRKLLANKEILIPNEPTLVKQLSIYREDDSRLPTDRVISLALACWLATDGAQNHNNEVVEVDW